MPDLPTLRAILAIQLLPRPDTMPVIVTGAAYLVHLGARLVLRLADGSRPAEAPPDGGQP